jgi:hypothetical protein
VRAYARFRIPDGSSVELGHGDLIGRLWSAALCLSDARISEAHALVSLRGQELNLLALRGRFAVDGERRTAVALEPGQRIVFAEGLALTVEDIQLPTTVLGIEGDGLPRQVLNGVCSLLTRPRPELVPRFVRAGAHIWTDGEGWQIELNGAARRLHPGDEWELDGLKFRAVAASLASAGRSATRLEGGVQSVLRVVANFETAHVHPLGREPLALSGLSARILSELVAFGGPVAWQVLSKELWPKEDDLHLLRRKLDVNLARLRRKLREAGIRPDLIRADGFGHFELFLHEGDEAADHT